MRELQVIGLARQPEHVAVIAGMIAKFGLHQDTRLISDTLN